MKTLSLNTGRRTPAALLAAALVFAALALLAAPRGASAQIFAQPEGGHWAVAVALNAWVPTVNGDLLYDLPEGEGGRDFNVKIGPNDYLTHLNFALPVSIDLRNDRWSVLTDVTYVNLGQDSNVTAVRPAGGLPIEVSANLSTNTDLKGLLWTEAFGWTIAGHPSGSFADLMIGVRYFGLKSETKWHLSGAVDIPGSDQVILPRDGKSSHDKSLWDGIFGIRGKARLGEHWSIPFYADAGLGNSKFTWQGSAGIDWAPGKLEFALCYRQMSWEQKEDKFVQGLRLGGPQLSIGYRF
jgi:hypothetical protein